MVSTTAKRLLFAPETGSPFLVLLTLEHPELPAPLRVVNDRRSVRISGVEYFPFPFGIELPNQDFDSPPMARLFIDNVSREITEIVRSINTPASILLQVINRPNSDVVEASFRGLSLFHVAWQPGSTILGDLSPKDLSKVVIPPTFFTPANTPALF